VNVRAPRPYGRALAAAGRAISHYGSSRASVSGALNHVHESTEDLGTTVRRMRRDGTGRIISFEPDSDTATVARRIFADLRVMSVTHQFYTPVYEEREAQYMPQSEAVPAS